MKRIISLVLILNITIMLFSSFGLVSADTSSEWWQTYEPPADAFDYEIKGDPLDISDEDFFGVYDSATGIWTTPSYFDYVKYADELALVIEAAKKGDYATAKDELLNYYLTVRDGRYSRIMSHPGKQSLIQADLMMKNAYTVNGSQCGYVQGSVVLDNEWQEYSLDVTSRFTGKVAGYQAKRGFAFMSVDKFPTFAEIKSRESGTPAQLEFVINGGVSVTVNACDDAYTRGGGYNKTNFGTEDVLKIKSSGYYHNWNEDTHHAYISFDISFLKTTDTVDSVILKFTGRNASGTGEKEVVVYQQNNINFDEEKVTFSDYQSEDLFWSCNDINTWDYIASEDATIKGKACFWHRGSELAVPAELYSYTGDEKYAFTFIRQHMGLVDSVGFDIRYFNELDMGTHLLSVTQNIYQVLDSKYMTGDILTGMLKNMWQQADYLQRVFYGKKDNNWASFATGGVQAFLARFREFACYDEWMENTVAENNRLISTTFVMADGMCIELPLNYINTLIGTMENHIGIAQGTDTPLPFDKANIDNIRKCIQTVIYCTGPDMRGFNIAEGNDYTTNYTFVVRNWYNTIFADDDEIAYIATGGLEGKMPDNPTTHYPVGLRTYFRSAWADPNALVMAITAKGDASHAHKDKLSIALYGYGEYLLTDQAYGSTLTDDTVDYMMSAPQHNLVTVNGKDHANIKQDGVEEAFESNSLYDFVEYSGTFVVDAMQQRSAMYLKNQKLYIITDFAVPTDANVQNSYEQNWHMLPAANMTVDAETLTLRSNMENANVMVVPVELDGLTHSWEDAKFVSGSGLFEDTKKAVLKRTVKGNSKFSTVILPMSANQNFNVSTTPVDVGALNDVANAFAFTVTDLVTGEVNQYYYYHHNVPETKQPVTIGAYTTDATTMLVQQDSRGNFVSMFLMDATYLNDSSLGTQNVRFKSNTPVEAIAYEESSQVAKISSSAIVSEADLDNITVYTGYKSGAKLNGETVSSQKSGGYMYFGDTPIITGDPLPDVGETGGSGDLGGNIHGGGGGGGGASKPPKDDRPNPDTKPDDGNGNIAGSTPVITVPDNIKKELSDHWGKDLIEDLYKQGIVTGDGNSLNLKNSVTRAEFTALIVRALGLEDVDYSNEFLDVNAKDWYAPYIAVAYKSGLINGADGMFRPNDTITREEICKIISSLLNEEKISEEIPFNDKDQISPWAVEGVLKAYSLGIINGMDNTAFAPKEAALREQAFVILARLLEVLNS